MKNQNTKHLIPNTKNNRGITLVALVITIIVLLILAVVAIKAVTDDSIINYAKNASAEFELGKKEEEGVLANYLNVIKDNVPQDSDQTPGGTDDSGNTEGSGDSENTGGSGDSGNTEGSGDSENTGGSEPIETIPTDQSYVGYYADINADNVVDGIIYSDFATGGSGEWGTNGNGKYTITVKNNLDSYYVIKEEHQESGFPAKPVIAPIDKDAINDRFYVMALSDFTDGTYTQFNWYTNAVQGDNFRMTDYADTTFPDFEKGRTNTNTMLNKVYGAGLMDGDIWKHVTAKVSEGWFVPSSAEWSAFLVGLDMTSNNREGRGMGELYWSSTQASDFSVYYIDFPNGNIGPSFGAAIPINIRLSTTF